MYSISSSPMGLVKSPIFLAEPMTLERENLCGFFPQYGFLEKAPGSLPRPKILYCFGFEADC
jgi:hypothetical protein